jgi:hypothetical protein
MNSKKIQRSEWNKEDNTGYERWISKDIEIPKKKKYNWDSGNEKLNKSNKNTPLEAFPVD